MTPPTQVLELPQVIAVDHGEAAAAADSTDPTDDSASSADQPGDVDDYADQEAVGSALPGAALAPVTPTEPHHPARAHYSGRCELGAGVVPLYCGSAIGLRAISDHQSDAHHPARFARDHGRMVAAWPPLSENRPLSASPSS